MTKEKFIGARGKSEADPGLDALRERVKAQQAQAKERKAAPAAAEKDPHLEAMKARVAEQRATAAERTKARIAAQEAALKKAAKK